MISIEVLKNTNIILSILVALHIVLELYHYVSEWLKNRRDRKILEHIDDHLDNMDSCACGGSCKNQKDDKPS